MKIQEMTDEHLKNRIEWAKRNGPPDPWLIHGDEPQYGAGGFMASVAEMNYHKWRKHIIDMQEELKRREQAMKDSYIKKLEEKREECREILKRKGLHVEDTDEGIGLSISLTQFGLSTVYATLTQQEIEYIVNNEIEL